MAQTDVRIAEQRTQAEAMPSGPVREERLSFVLQAETSAAAGREALATQRNIAQLGRLIAGLAHEVERIKEHVELE